MLSILNSLRRWTASALSLANPTPLSLAVFDTESPCRGSGGISSSSHLYRESPMQAIVEFVRANPGTSRGKVAAYLGLDLVSASRALRKLVRGGTLMMSGSKRGTTYSVAREGAGGAQTAPDASPYPPAA